MIHLLNILLLMPYITAVVWFALCLILYVRKPHGCEKKKMRSTMLTAASIMGAVVVSSGIAFIAIDGASLRTYLTDIFGNIASVLVRTWVSALPFTPITVTGVFFIVSLIKLCRTQKSSEERRTWRALFIASLIALALTASSMPFIVYLFIPLAA